MNRAIPLYYPQEVNRCPGCGRSHWHVGRTLAECAFCGTALALVDPIAAEALPVWRRAA